MRQFQTIEDSSSAINQSTGVNGVLTEMIMKYHCPGQKMAVGELGYKKIIEERLVSISSTGLPLFCKELITIFAVIFSRK